MKKDLRIAAISGIVALVLYFPVLVIGTFKGISLEGVFPVSLVTLYTVLIVISIIASILFFRGFILIGKKLKNRFLTNISYVIIVSTVIFTGYDLVSLNYPELTNLTASVIILIFFGVVGLLFGIALLHLEKKFGRIAKAAGILEIISGISLVTVFLVFIMILLYIPITILEILILFRAAEKF